jgi:hypothetical protein
MQTVFASRHALLGKGGYTDWGFALLALDVAYDTRMNAYVLDVNSGVCGCVWVGVWVCECVGL